VFWSRKTWRAFVRLVHENENSIYKLHSAFCCTACFAFPDWLLRHFTDCTGRCTAARWGYPNFNTAEGAKALFSLTTGAANTAMGWFSLYSNTDGSFNTGVGAGTLLST
jgi:hypothetical protein